MTNLPEEYTCCILRQRPTKNDPTFSDGLFEAKKVPMPALEDEGQVIVKVLLMSCDPAQRVWVGAEPQYGPPVAIGEPMRAVIAGEVVASRSDALPVGVKVAGFGSWSEYLTGSASSFHLAPPGMPLENFLAAGFTQQAAYVGLVFRGKVKPGETVFVSGAAGATGSGVVQIAKLSGCYVIGCAGGPEKCQKVLDLGADACIDYKSEDVEALLRELTEKRGGIDVYFDNVGGEILDAALANLAIWARVVICGAISQYNTAEVRGPKNYAMLLHRRATMEGFIFLDRPDEVKAAQERIFRWIGEGKYKVSADVVEAPLSEAASVVRRLFSSQNKGKLVHKLA